MPCDTGWGEREGGVCPLLTVAAGEPTRCSERCAWMGDDGRCGVCAIADMIADVAIALDLARGRAVEDGEG